MMRTFFISTDWFAHDAGAKPRPRAHAPNGRVLLRLFATKVVLDPYAGINRIRFAGSALQSQPTWKILASTPSRRDSSHCLHKRKNTSDHRLAHKGGATFKSRDPTVYCP